MKYGFVLGRVYTLSIAELFAVLEREDKGLGYDGSPIKVLEASEEIIILETSCKLNTEKLQKKLGGVIKILEVVDVIKKRRAGFDQFCLKTLFQTQRPEKTIF